MKNYTLIDKDSKQYSVKVDLIERNNNKYYAVPSKLKCGLQSEIMFLFREAYRNETIAT